MWNCKEVSKNNWRVQIHSKDKSFEWCFYSCLRPKGKKNSWELIGRDALSMILIDGKLEIRSIVASSIVASSKK